MAEAPITAALERHKTMSWTTRLLPALAMSALLPGAAMAETVGVASWYGGRHDGLRTSSGEVFDQEGLTAASRSIPLGSRVRVTMAETGQSVVVTVNDRMGGAQRHHRPVEGRRPSDRPAGPRPRDGLHRVGQPANEPIEVAEASEDETSGHRHRRATWSAT